MLVYCKIASGKVVLDGFNVPRGAAYGRDHDEYYICQNYAKKVNSGLIMYVKNKKNDKRWKKVVCQPSDFRYKAVVKAYNELGLGNSYVPGAPYERKVNYRFMCTGSGVGQLARMRHDNADHYGGGSVIQNPDSYREIFVDMDRRYY